MAKKEIEKGSTAVAQKLIDHVVQCYGDMLFDLCDSVLWNSVNAQSTFRAVLKEIDRTPARDRYVLNERAWILHIAFEKLKSASDIHARRLTPSEQIELDASVDPAARLKQFPYYFHRLTAEDQILLLLRDKYGLPYGEIASAMNLPEGALKVRRQQAVRALEDWIWGGDQ